MNIETVITKFKTESKFIFKSTAIVRVFCVMPISYELIIQNDILQDDMNMIHAKMTAHQQIP